MLELVSLIDFKLNRPGLGLTNKGLDFNLTQQA